ncbi:AFG2-interacting ribosome maturation factor [Pholidichthys leucotaenia]
MSRLAVSTLHDVLRKSFASLESSQKLWISVLAECSLLMVSLGNLAEQWRALCGVRISNTPLRGFPDLENRLRSKLLEATDTVLVKLNEKMFSLQSIRDSISNQVSAVLQLYEQNADSLDLLAVTERSTTTPSVADMLEWLQDAERHYRVQFLRRKTLLQTLRADDLQFLESAPKRWKSLDSPGAQEQITDTLCKVSFFLESR